MRIINKKYLVTILLIGIILTGVIILKPEEEVKLDNVVLKQAIKNKTFAMYIENNNTYEEYNESKFPEEYILNLNESKCVDNNGKELDNIISYTNGELTVTSGNTTYCYLYFDKSLGLEIKEMNPNGLSICEYDAETKYEQCGGMHRFQGQQADGIENYICFGTSNKEECLKDTDHYMYRIIGIEAETGRVKVIKKEALNTISKWSVSNDDDIEFPKSKIYETISGTGFLENTDYVPEGWEEKISINTWTYGDMWSNSTIGDRQAGPELYLTETGQKATKWSKYATEDTPGAKPHVVQYSSSPHKGETVYSTEENGNWDKTFEGQISLMYLHDYYLSVGNEANCQSNENKYEMCQTGWMHLSQNDTNAPGVQEWTMSRHGYNAYSGWFDGYIVYEAGSTNTYSLGSSLSLRPVFYINASEKLLSGTGTGTINDPFMIKI